MDINGKKVRGIYFGNNIIVDGSELPPAPPAVDKTKAPLKSLIGNNSPTHAIVQETFTLTRGWYHVELAGCGGGSSSIVVAKGVTADCGYGGAGAKLNHTFAIYSTTTITVTVGTPGKGGYHTDGSGGSRVCIGGQGGKGAYYTDVEALELTLTTVKSAALGGASGGPVNQAYSSDYDAYVGHTTLLLPGYAKSYALGGGSVGYSGGQGGGPAFLIHPSTVSVIGAMYDDVYRTFTSCVSCGGGGGGYGKAADGFVRNPANGSTGGVGYSGGGGAAFASSTTGGSAAGGGGGSSILYIDDNNIFVAGGGGGGAGAVLNTDFPDVNLTYDLSHMNGKDGTTNIITVDPMYGGGGAGGVSRVIGNGTESMGANGGAGWAKIWKLT